MTSGNLRGALFMTLAMAAFAINDSCMKAITADMPLAQAIFLRGLLASTALAFIGMRQGRLRLRFGVDDRLRLGLRSLGEVAATLTFLSALRHMPLANLSAIMQALPLAVTLSAALVMREAVGWRRMAAIGVGFCGVLLIVRPGTDGFNGWSLIALASVAFVVVRDLSTRRLSPDVSSVSVAFLAAVSVTASAVLLLPFSHWTAVDPARAMLIAGAATFLIAGYLLIVMAMRVGDISLVAPFRYTALLFSIALGVVLFNELPDALGLAGAAVIVATGMYTFHRERKLGRVVATPVKAPLRLR